MFFNGWTHGHYVTNLIGFAPDEMIIFGIINAPGTVHDSTMASFFGVYDKLQKVYDETGLKCIMDSAFCASEYEFITKSSQTLNNVISMTCKRWQSTQQRRQCDRQLNGE
jgi:DDE superfamily endonuclease